MRRTIWTCFSAAWFLPLVGAAQGILAANPSFMRWAHDRAMPMRPVDESYADSVYDFLRPAVGAARVLALGEMIHGAHEPLEFRNEAIRYAVTRLGFTAVAIGGHRRLRRRTRTKR